VESRLAAQAIPPIPTHFSVAWSVCLSSSVTLVHPASTIRRIYTQMHFERIESPENASGGCKCRLVLTQTQQLLKTSP